MNFKLETRIWNLYVGDYMKNQNLEDNSYLV